ncbi:MAG: FAD-dependent oxidoreductase [Actinomycetota bacterium]
MSLRSEQLDRLDGGEVDVLVVGGGINGAVSAAALAGRGVSVAIVDRGDFASVTSQESSNLVWGGFKYLENYEIPLVLSLTGSRNHLMKAYPSTISELPFLATLDTTSPFPSWLAALGSVAYWGLGRFATDRPRYHRPKSIMRHEPIIRTDTADAAIEYNDGYLKDNDSRFVWGFVRSALDNGALAANYVSLRSAQRPTDGEPWIADLEDEVGGRTMTLRAKAVINAAGPYVDGLNDSWGAKTKHRIVYSKGIHLIVPQVTTSERVLAFFDDSQRLFYVIPMAHRSVIGTTDTRTDQVEDHVTDEERAFLLEQINARLSLETPLTTGDIISERSGVRPLVVPDDGDDRSDIDWTSLSRKHEVERNDAHRLVTIFGGKLTDCLNVGDEVADEIAALGIAVGKPNDLWYGEPDADARHRFLRVAAAVGLDRAPEVEREESLAAVLWRRHGEAAHAVVDAIKADPSSAEPIMPESDILVAEVELYADREMIVHLDDFLRRRTKLAMLHRAEALDDEPGLKEAAARLLP